MVRKKKKKKGERRGKKGAGVKDKMVNQSIPKEEMMVLVEALVLWWRLIWKEGFGLWGDGVAASDGWMD